MIVLKIFIFLISCSTYNTSVRLVLILCIMRLRVREIKWLDYPYTASKLETKSVIPKPIARSNHYTFYLLINPM